MKIDAIGLVCPEPIMLLHKAIHESSSGEIIELIATDPATKKDVEKLHSKASLWSSFSGTVKKNLNSFKEENNQFVFQVEKK